MRKADPTEAKRLLILAHALKTPFEKGEPTSGDLLQTLYNQAGVKYEGCTEPQLDALINGLETGKSLKQLEQEPYVGEDLDRVRRYSELSWAYDIVSLEKIGAWPEMRGIDPKLTTETITKTSIEIGDYIAGKLNLTLQRDRERKLRGLIRIIDSMRTNPLIKKLPLILVPGDSIRGESYRRWVMENHGDYHKHDTSILGVDEGNVRALTLALMGEREASAYVGEYKK